MSQVTTRAGWAALSTGGLAALGYWVGFGPSSQLCGRFPFRGPSDEKTVALTFDDGPNEPYTSALLDTLADRQVPATFFQVGRCAERHPDVTRRVVAEGHVLANHSYRHSLRSYVSDPTSRDELRRGRQVLADIAGVQTALYRPPWLCHWPWVLRGVADAGAQVVSGTFAAPLEIAQPPARRLTAAAARRARPGAVLILHDGREARGGPRKETVDSVGPLVDRLRAHGYRFTTVDRLLACPAYA